LYEVVHFNIMDAIQHNFVVMPFVITLFCWASTLIFKNSALLKVAWIMTCITATVFVIIYILRIIG
jgi:hypothetical protein